MSWHVIGTLQRMLILWTILWDKMVEDGFHVYPNIWISIFVNAQSATRMFAEYVDDASLGNLGNWRIISLVTKWKPLDLD